MQVRGKCRTSRARASRRHLMAMSVSLLSAMRDTATPGPFCVTQCLPCDYYLRQRRSGHTRDPCTSCSPTHNYRGVGDNVHVPVPRVHHLLLLDLRIYGEMLQMPDLCSASSHHSRQSAHGRHRGPLAVAAAARVRATATSRMGGRQRAHHSVALGGLKVALGEGL